MATQYAVLHTQKMKSVGGGLGHHIDRTLGMEHNFRHADPKRLHDNQDYTSKEYAKMSLPEAIQKRISEGYKGHRKIRSDSVKALTTILSGSHEQMVKLKEKGKLNEWAMANLNFMEKRYGKENIVRFNMHLDEKTPHIHWVTVPLTADGRLSAKDFIGNRANMKQLQTDYANEMRPFELYRGVERTAVYHETAKDYYRRINITENFIDSLDSKSFLGMTSNKTLDNTKKELKKALNEVRIAKRESEKSLGLLKNKEFYHKQSERLLGEFREESKSLKKNIEKYKILIREMAQDPGKLNQVKDHILRQDRERENRKGRDNSQGFEM